jgi:hypothetical protein
MRVPAELCTPSARPYQELPELTYPLHDWTAVVTHCSRICFNWRKVNLSQVFAGPRVGVRLITSAKEREAKNRPAGKPARRKRTERL